MCLNEYNIYLNVYQSTIIFVHKKIQIYVRFNKNKFQIKMEHIISAQKLFTFMKVGRESGRTWVLCNTMRVSKSMSEIRMYGMN